jgi:hypothetical protein
MKRESMHMMSTRLLRGAGAAVLFASLVCAQAGPDGHWEGSYTVNNREIGISLDLAKNAKSEWIASMGLPSQNMTGLVVMDVAVNGKSVKFVAVELQMATCDLTLGPDGRMKGTMSAPQGPMSTQGPMPVELKRTGEAKVELIPRSPAVSKELEGDWEGSLQDPKGALHPLVFHFKNLPDKTVAATMDNPERNFMAMPLNNVKQTGQKVEFGLKIAGASFQGSLNKEGTELALQMIHDASSTPFITLRKK